MALVEIRVDGIIAALSQAALAIKREVADLVAATAVRVREDLRRAYRRGPTGRLQGWMTVRIAPRQSADPVLRAWQVRAYAPHVHLYEQGTRERYDPTRRNARRGRSPAHGAILARLASQHRRMLVQAIATILDRPRRLG